MQIDNEFSLTTVSQVQSLCMPFLKDYNLGSFNYARIFADRSMLAVHSDAGFAQLYLDLNCCPVAPIPENYWEYNSFYYFPQFSVDEAYKILLNKSTLLLKSDNPLYLVNQTDNFIEIAAFCSVIGEPDVINRYLNNLKELRIFVDYFREKTNSLFQEADHNRLYLPEYLRPQIPQSIENHPANTKYHHFYRYLVLKQAMSRELLSRLTPREIQCLYYLCKGYGYKAIANQLNISFRTVENHISNSKSKLLVTTNSKLVKLLSINSD